MKTVKIEVKVQDELEAYKLVNEINFKHKVSSAKYSRRSREDFSNKQVKNFLKNDEATEEN